MSSEAGPSHVMRADADKQIEVPSDMESASDTDDRALGNLKSPAESASELSKM